jgi:CheY-like chemotaxis protein
LVVDDVYINRRILVKNLQMAGYLALEAENGKQAIEILQNNNVDCIFMDIEMPVMNGLETTRYIRSQLKPPKSSVKIFALTAYNDSSVNEYLNFSEFDGFVSKPFTFEQLEKILQSF